MTTHEEVLISDEDKVAIRESLLLWKSEGVENPMIPIDVDIDGDGKTDAFGLDENDELIVVTDAEVSETVYESTGEDVETGGSDEL